MGNDESAGDSSTPESPVYEVEIPVSALLRLAVVVIATVLVLAALSRAQQLVGVGITALTSRRRSARRGATP